MFNFCYTEYRGLMSDIKKIFETIEKEHKKTILWMVLSGIGVFVGFALFVAVYFILKFRGII